ncbi:MAG: hypothetical protein KatS3mg090_0235 [Patescibacteria group bacterium]|nr:MAG: hypothetical protein KatS3mg090_0235 [Patescibacteria group bacterium]
MDIKHNLMVIKLAVVSVFKKKIYIALFFLFAISFFLFVSFFACCLNQTRFAVTV